jgi:hypothetical protein
MSRAQAHRAICTICQQQILRALCYDDFFRAFDLYIERGEIAPDHHRWVVERKRGVAVSADLLPLTVPQPAEYLVQHRCRAARYGPRQRIPDDLSGLPTAAEPAPAPERDIVPLPADLAAYDARPGYRHLGDPVHIVPRRRRVLALCGARAPVTAEGRETERALTLSACRACLTVWPQYAAYIAAEKESEK